MNSESAGLAELEEGDAKNRLADRRNAVRTNHINGVRGGEPQSEKVFRPFSPVLIK